MRRLIAILTACAALAAIAIAVPAQAHHTYCSHSTAWVWVSPYYHQFIQHWNVPGAHVHQYRYYGVAGIMHTTNVYC